MIPGKKEKGPPDPSGGEEPEFTTREPGAEEEAPDSNPIEGDEGSGGGYGRPREVDDEDEGKHI